MPLVTVDPNQDVDTVTIIATVNNDQAVASITNVTPAGEDGTVGEITVELTQPADYAVTIPIFATFGSGTGDASSGDVNPIVGTVTFQPGDTTAIVTYTAIDDALSELPEDFSLALGTPSLPPGQAGGLLSNPNITNTLITSDPTIATGTIIDNDGPQFSISSPTVVEGTGSGTTFLQFDVMLDTPISFAVDVDVVFGSSSGAFGSADFDGTAQTVTFAANSTTTQTIQVQVFHDNLVEANETFTAALVENTPVSALGAGFGSGTGTITNDDTVTFTISNDSVTEGTGGGFSTLTFDVTPSNPVDINIPIDVDFTDISADGFDFDTVLDQAAPNNVLPFGADYDTDGNEGGSGPNTSLVFPAGSTATRSVNVRVAQDNIVEGGLNNSFGTETFRADISTSNSNRSTVTTDSGTGTIFDDDSATVIVFATDGLAAEPGATGGNGEYEFSLSNPVQGDVVIDFSFTVDGLAGDANNDIVAEANLDAGQITIPGSTFNGTTAGNVTTAVTIPIVAENDTLLEDDEDVLLMIDSLPSALNDPNVSIDFDSGVELVEIVDDDTTQISIMALDPEAVEGGVTATYEVSIGAVADVDTTIDLEVIASGTTAAASDYSGIPTSVTIPAGQTSVTFEVTAVNDSVTEGIETLEIGLVSGSLNSNADITIDPTKQTDSIDILDDGDGLKVSITSSQDGREDDIDGVFTFSLTDSLGNAAVLPSGSTPGGAGIEVFYRIVVGSTTATVTSDFSFNQASVVFLEGQGTSDLTLDILEDTIIDPNETVTIEITGIQYRQTALPATTLLNGEEICFSDTTQTLTIEDNDFAVPPAVTGIFVNGTNWTDLFRDRLDGVEDGPGTGIGYQLSSEATLPWINVDQIIVQYDSAIDPASIDISDFALTGTPGLNAGFVSASIPGITGASAGPNNTVVLDLGFYLEASNLNLAVNGTGLTSSGVAGTDSSVSFTALPGDSEQTGSIVNAADITEVVSRQNSLIFPGGTLFNYAAFSDVNGDQIINATDLQAIVDRQNSLVFSSLVSNFASNSELDDSDDDKLEKGNGDLNSDVVATISQSSIEPASFSLQSEEAVDNIRDRVFESHSSNSSKHDQVQQDFSEVDLLGDLL